MATDLDVAIPTFARAEALAVTLATLALQTAPGFRVIVSDQTEGRSALAEPVVQAPLRLLRARGHAVTLRRHLPRRGLAEHRQSLLDVCDRPYLLFIDDDVLLEPFVVQQMRDAIEGLRCGFVGSAVHGLSFIEDHRPDEEAIEFWEGDVEPESIIPGGPQWSRHRLHNAANLLHLQQRLGVGPGDTRPYRVAWVGGCVLYDTARLRKSGGFEFWRDLPPEHSGEDVLAQLRVMARFGGCGLLPSGAYHQELPTTVVDRTVDAPFALPEALAS